MTLRLHDTHFGHLIRPLSGNRLFRFPDEIDISSWERCTIEESRIDAAIPDDQPQSSKEDEEKSRSIKRSSSGRGTQGVVDGQASHAADIENEKVILVGWYSSDDPENPRNWARSWKLVIASQICLFNFAVYAASSIYVPGEPNVIAEFRVSEEVATLGLSLFTVGYGFGPMLWSPMSEIPKLGRCSIYFWTLLAFILLQLPTGFAVDMPMFLVFRFLTGFFGSPCLATGGGTIMDIYEPAQAAYGISIWGGFGILGPVVGPIIGGYVAPVKGWRWTIWIITWLCTLVLALLFFLMPETSAANILLRRAKRLRKATGNPRLRSQSEIDAQHYTTRDHLSLLGNAFNLTFSEPVVFFLDLYTALLYGVLFIWFESFPLVFGGIYDFDLGQQGLAFLGILVGAIIALPLFLLWIKYGLQPRLSRPNFKPETVLLPAFFGSTALPICLFWYGWSARRTIHWIMPIVGSGFFSIGIVMLFNPVLGYLGMAYPDYSASIFAGNALFRASFGATFPLFARQLFTKLGIGPGNSLLGGVAVGFMFLPFFFYTFGAKLRGMSKNATHDK